MEGFKGPVGSPHPRHRGRSLDEVCNAGRNYPEHPAYGLPEDEPAEPPIPELGEDILKLVLLEGETINGAVGV